MPVKQPQCQQIFLQIQVIFLKFQFEVDLLINMKEIISICRQQAQSYLRSSIQQSTQKIHFVKDPIIHKTTKQYFYCDHLVLKYMVTMYLQKQNKLKIFCLSNCGIGDRGSQLLSQIEFLHLRVLILASNGITQNGLKYIANIRMKKLQIIDLSQNNLGNQSLKYLVNANCSFLRKVYLTNINITGLGLKQLIPNKWVNLQKITLRNNKLDNSSLRYISQSNFNRLAVFDIANNYLTSSSMTYFCRSSWTFLEEIDIHGNFIEDEGIKLLIAQCSSKLKKLTLASLWGSQKTIRISFTPIKYFTKFVGKKLQIILSDYIQKSEIINSKCIIEAMKGQKIDRLRVIKAAKNDDQ